MDVERYISQQRAANRKMIAVLLDPENMPLGEKANELCQLIREARPDFVFVGGSTWYESTQPLVDLLHQEASGIPVVLFPGHPSQFTPKADALLFLSLISGDNPDTLIRWQAESARAIRQSGIETISTGYILVEGGSKSTTAAVTHTSALPANRITDTAIAGEMLGLHTIYLEAGSGAATPASAALISDVRQQISCPLIVGGGLSNREQIRQALDAGADIVVVGNHLERHPGDLIGFCEEVHQ